MKAKMHAGTALWIVVALGLSACGGSSSSKSSSSPAPAPSSILLQSDSGTPRAADGTWINCQSGNSLREEHTFSGASLSINTYTGTSGGTCTGGSFDATQSGSLTISGQTTFTIVNWVNGTGTIVAAPAKASGSGSLSTTPTASLYTMTGTYGGSPITGPDVAFVDDSTGVYRLYRSSQSGSCPQVSGHDACLTTVDYMNK